MPADPTHIQAVFLAAAEIADPAAREVFLAEACSGDLQLKSRVEALLRAHDQPDSLLDAPLVEPPDLDLATTRVFSPDAEHADTRTSDGVADTSEKPLTFLSPATRPDSLGRIGHYEVLQVLGRGGFGIVFRAFDDVLHRVVAVKVLAPQLAVTSPARKRFLREARTSAQVRHENVVQVHEVGEQPLPYLVMEFIPGETLQQRLDRLGPVEPAEVVRTGRQIAEGLAAAHANDLIHRDIKPGNILLEGAQQKVKITDFGLARAADDASISQSGIIAGTPMYMAPEQALGHKLDQRADLFSLGSVLYVMAAGRPPFRANGTVAVLKRVADDTPRDIREIIPETPQWLCDIIAKLHAKNPDDRFQSAREVADLLADCEVQLKASSKLKDYSRIPHSKSRRSGRRRWLAVATVLLLPVIVLAVTEFAGVTHLFRGRQTTELNKPEPPPLAIAPFDAEQAKKHQEVWAKYLGLPVEFTNSIGMKFRLIPPGEFTMGSSPEELTEVLSQVPAWAHVRILSEAPARRVQVTQPYYMGTTEVTVGQFKQFVAATNYKTRAESNGVGGVAWTGKKNETKPEFTWRHKDLTQSDFHPVGQLCPADANEFCLWAQSLDGRSYGLPDEEHWEYACRAGTVTPWSCGTDAAVLDDHGLGVWNLGFSGRAVAQKPSNPFGLFDVHGNFDEMCRCKDGKYVCRGGAGVADKWLNRSAVRMPIRLHETFSVHGFRVAIVGNLNPGASTPSPEAKKPKDADRRPVTAAPSIDADRRAAEYVLSIGGKVRIEGNDHEILAQSDLPIGALRLTIVHLNHNEQVTDAGLAAFENCTNVTELHLFGCTQITDAGLAHFEHCKNLTCLFLGHVSATDDALAFFAGCKNLTHLELTNTQVTDKGLVNFKDCKKLIEIHLGNTPVSDSGLAHLKDCKNLTVLDLRGTQVTDTGLAYFKDCKELWRLGLGETSITDSGLAHFKDCKNLADLWLGSAAITDAGVANFKDCKNLKYLRLECTQVGDAGLANFADCKDLNLLILSDTRLSNAGLAQFKGMPLRNLWIDGTGITDLTPLQGMPLEEIRLTPKNITKGLDMLRDMKSLKTIDTSLGQYWPAAAFWERYDRGEFK
jgi:serine/threonine protein kinase